MVVRSNVDEASYDSGKCLQVFHAEQPHSTTLFEQVSELR